VEVLAQPSDESRIHEFENRLRRGPSFARVDELRLVNEDMECEYSDFCIK
jgi:acylphosphatase